MDKLNPIEIGNRAIKIEMKNGESKSGYLPGLSSDKEFNQSFIYFLPWKKNEEFNSKFNVGQAISSNEADEYLEVISKATIRSFEILEQEIAGIHLESKKPIPNWLEIRLKNISNPGYIYVEYKIPQHDQWFEIGDLRVKNSMLYLPLTLAFISYSKEDQSRVRKVMRKLHNHGILTWFDENDLIPGNDWEAKIEEAIEKADYVLVFLSSKTTQKIGYKNKEIEYALKQRELRPSGKRYIIPVLLDDFKPPREFNDIHWLKSWGNNWLKKLVSAVGGNPTEFKKSTT